MQDRFKFKGYWYNDVQKEWWVYDNPEFITGDGTAEIWSNSEDGAYPELPSDAELHLCQCTGLKDKNGKLIYEGDIVEKSTFIDYNGNAYQPDVYLDRVDIGVVHFTASNGAVLRKVKTFLTDDPYKEREPLPKKDQPKMVKLFACRSEIIGNIYENPELLED